MTGAATRSRAEVTIVIYAVVPDGVGAELAGRQEHHTHMPHGDVHDVHLPQHLSADNRGRPVLPPFPVSVGPRFQLDWLLIGSAPVRGGHLPSPVSVPEQAPGHDELPVMGRAPPLDDVRFERLAELPPVTLRLV